MTDVGNVIDKLMDTINPPYLLFIDLKEVPLTTEQIETIMDETPQYGVLIINDAGRVLSDELEIANFAEWEGCFEFMHRSLFVIAKGFRDPDYYECNYECN